MLLKNELFLVILENFIYNVTIIFSVWLAVTIGFADEELFYKLVIFTKPKKSTNKATAAESCLSKIGGREVMFNNLRCLTGFWNASDLTLICVGVCVEGNCTPLPLLVFP